ncbi:MAG: zinc ABC transporter permease subunit ZnuB [Porticoccaceae bacterium]
MIEVLLLALLAGLGVAVVTGPLGAFIVWRRMAYFGDTLAHSSLLGVALALLLSIAPTISVVIVCLALALLLVALQQQQTLASDTLLGILSHTSLAVGMVAMSLMPTVQVDLLSLLFGDLLTVTTRDVITIYVIGAMAIALLIRLWKPLLAITIHEDLARVEGVPVTAVRTALMLIVALEIAIAMKVVGVLLITALLVIPAATARRFAHNPEQMAIFASLLGGLSVLMGLAASWFMDTPAGPSIVVSAGLLFMASLLRKEY